MAFPTRGSIHRSLLLLLISGLTASLAACGEVQAPEPGATGSTVPVLTEPQTGRQPGTAPGDLPATTEPATTVPAGPPPRAFVERAQAVAAAVRKAGLPTQPAGPVLLSPWAVDLPFERDAQKVAWNAGEVVFTSGVRGDEIGVSTLTLPDGSQRPVDVIAARAAVERALEGERGDCAGIPADECELTLTKATLTMAKVTTTEGEATVPAWSFAVKGLSRPIVVVATARGVLERPVPPTPVPGLPSAEPGLSSADALVAASDSTITVQIGHGACDRDLTGHAVEFADLVVVGGTHTPPDPGTVCTMQYLLAPSVLRLAHPLGERVVIDIASGAPRHLGVPAS
ncbi:hypothetical protein [Intrasporangium sp. DVR]|uniref:hypothetical protein n=1 Tax=Intrasporangium sp. DVR TaxID=3127867 RepID=UPI0033412720